MTSNKLVYYPADTPPPDFSGLPLFALFAAQPEPQAKPFELRDYQRRVIAETYGAIKKGFRRILIVSATGSGKTATASKIIDDAIGKGRRVLFLVHRDTLIPQTQQALKIYGIEAGIIKSGYREDRSKAVQIASVQSLARRDFPEDIGLVIVDECHTVAWYATYERVKAVYCDAIHIGLTATPWRTKSADEYFGQHFQIIVQAPSPAELINLGYLSQPRYFAYGGLVDLARIDNGSDGDFNVRQMENRYMAAGVSDRIVRESLNLLGLRTGLIFCAGVDQSKQIAKLFNQAGIPTEHLDGETSQEDRTAMYDRLRSGKTKLLSSVAVLTEGFDIPSISFIALARATRSRALLFQMAGRGLRLAEGKKDCLLLDFGENFKRLNFITSKQPITLDPIPRKEGEAPLKECPNCHAEIYAFQMVCPECGYEFPPSEGEDEEDAEASDAEFGEVFPPEVQPKIKYLRSQIRTRFKKRQPIDRVWETFNEKFGHYPPNEWHLGAIFGTDRSDVNRQKFLDYLYELNPNPKQHWVKFHVELEFGMAGRSYKTRSGTYTPPPATNLERKEWWKILQVMPMAEREDIKRSYRDLAKKYHPDCSGLPEDEAKSRMQLLNWAFQQAKIARGI